MPVHTSLSFWYFAMLSGFCEHWKRNKMLEIWYNRVNKYFGYDQGLVTQLAHPCVSNGNIHDSNSPTLTIKLSTKKKKKTSGLTYIHDGSLNSRVLKCHGNFRIGHNSWNSFFRCEPNLICKLPNRNRIRRRENIILNSQIGFYLDNMM